MSIFQCSFDHPHFIWNNMFNYRYCGDGCSKEERKHTEWGEIYHASYVVITLTAIILSIINWDKIAYLFYVAIFSYAFAIYGYLARKKRWKNWIHHHITGMLGSYIGAVTALLVNVGIHIPIINLLPPIWFWFLPTLIGIPLVASVSKKI